VAELYRSLSIRQVASELGVAYTTVRRDLLALGVERRPQARPVKYPPVGPRLCANPGCGRVFTPRSPSMGANGRGQFCSHACASEGKRIYPQVSEMTCARSGCGRVFTPAGDAVANGGGLFCSARCAQLARRLYPEAFYEPRVCARDGCSNVFVPHACHVDAGMARFCSSECWGLWRFHQARNVPDGWVQREGQGCWSPLSRQRWGGRIGGRLGAAAGIEAGRAKGGRPPLLTPDQQLQILELDKIGHSSREIAEIVFGDSRLKDRVLRFLHR